MTGIDATFYGRENVAPLEPAVAGINPSELPDVNRTVDVGAVPAGQATAQGGAIQQGVQYLAPTRWESITAGVANTRFMQAYEFFTKPEFEPDGADAPKGMDFVKQLPFTLTESEYTKLMQAPNAGERQWLVDNYTKARELGKIAGEYPFTALAIDVIGDPTTYIAGLGALKAGKVVQAANASKALAAARAVGPLAAGTEAAIAGNAAVAATGAARVAGAVTGAALEGTVNLAAAEARPVSNAEQAMQMLMAAAGGAFSIQAGKLVPIAKDFPQEALQEAVSKPHMRLVSPAEYVDDVVPAVMGKRVVQPAKYVDEVVPGVAAVTEDATVTLAKNLKGAAPRYGYRGSNYELVFDSDVERAAYIVAGSGKSKQHDAYMQFLKDATGLQEPEIIALGQHVRSTVKAEAKNAPGDSITVPKLYKGDVRTAPREVTPAKAAGTTRRKVADEVVEDYEITPASTTRRKVKDAVFEEVPKPLRDGASATKVEIADAVEAEVEVQAKSWGKSFGEAVMWNVNKTLRNLGGAGDETADILTDNNHKYGLTSVESHKEAVKRDLGALQWSYEDQFRAGLAERGHGFMKMLVSNKASREASAKLESDIAREFMRRDTLFRAGRPITPDGIDPLVYKLADSKAKVYERAMKELQLNGVQGAENIVHNPGYFPRVHAADRMERVLDDLMAGGKTERQARDALVVMYRGSIRRANPQMTEEVSHDIAGAMVDRTIRKGRLEDTARNSTFGVDTAAEVRDILKGSGISGDRLERAIEAMLGKTDEQGKASFLKHRIDMDYSAGMLVNGKVVTVADMIETNVNTLMDKYIDKVASQVAFTRKGLTSESKIAELRAKYTKGAAKREEAQKMFDNVIAHLQGRPTGENMPELMRNASAYNRMITLGASGIWQATEYVNMMHRYGIAKTLKYTMAELPMFKTLMETAAKDKQLSMHLKDILTNVAEQNVRMRPYLSRFEDNFEIPQGSRISHMAQQGQQMIPYLNMMKYMHSHQARLHSNLLLDVIKRAANGDVKSLQHLEKYGLKAQGIDKLKNAVNTHGFAVDKWDDGVWAMVRPTLTKMTDESILHARMGDMPAFALMHPAGKFIFTYRSFVLTSHNKVLAGTSSREGLGAVALMAAYQFPLSAMAVQVNEVAKGREPLNGDKLITKAIGQMGSIGMLGEFASYLFGDKREVGSPGLIPFDRAARAMSSSSAALFGDGEANQAVKDGLALIPLLGVTIGSGAVKHLVTEE